MGVLIAGYSKQNFHRRTKVGIKEGDWQLQPQFETLTQRWQVRFPDLHPAFDARAAVIEANPLPQLL